MCIVSKEKEENEPCFDGSQELKNTGFLIRNHQNTEIDGYMNPLSVNVTDEMALHNFLEIIHDWRVNESVKDTLTLYKKVENEDGCVSWKEMVKCVVSFGKKKLIRPDGSKFF